MRSSLIQRFLIALACSAGLTACGKEAPAVKHSITAADLDALPALTTTDGTTICNAIDGDTTITAYTCPRLTASGNWIAPDVYAFWEMNRLVQVVQHGTVTTIKSTDISKMYTAAVAVGPGNAAGEISIVDPVAAVAYRYTFTGDAFPSEELPDMSQLSLWGFSGTIPVWQEFVTSADHLTADVVVRAGKKLGDADAREAFRANLPWLHLINKSVTIAPPLFPNTVVYAFDNDGNVVWSDGAQFVVKKTGTKGQLIWETASDVTGPAVDSTDLALKRADLTAPGLSIELAPSILDSMTAATKGINHPAISSVLLAPDRTTLVARSVLPQRDSVDFVRLREDGLPRDRFTLPKSSQVVLFGADSVLVFRKATAERTAGSLLWIKLGGATN